MESSEAAEVRVRISPGPGSSSALDLYLETKRKPPAPPRQRRYTVNPMMAADNHVVTGGVHDHVLFYIHRIGETCQGKHRHFSTKMIGQAMTGFRKARYDRTAILRRDQPRRAQHRGGAPDALCVEKPYLPKRFLPKPVNTVSTASSGDVKRFTAEEEDGVTWIHQLKKRQRIGVNMEERLASFQPKIKTEKK